MLFGIGNGEMDALKFIGCLDFRKWAGSEAGPYEAAFNFGALVIPANAGIAALNMTFGKSRLRVTSSSVNRSPRSRG